MQVDEFLKTVITTDSGNFCLAHRKEGEWAEQFFRWPDELDRIVLAASELREQGDVYFSAHLFKEPRSLKANVLPSRTLQADLDTADTATIAVLPTILTQTSPERHQGFWIVDKPLTPAQLENVSRRIAYGVPDCDHTGWPAGKKVRLPNTYNYKRPPDKHAVDIVGVSLRELKLEMFNMFPELMVSEAVAEADVEWVDNELTPLTVDTFELLAEIKSLIPSRVFSQYTRAAKDRSAALWAFNVEVLKAGCSREQAFWLAKFNANNKFADRPNGDRELRKDILRAEQHSANRQLDARAIVMDLRHRAGKLAAERLVLVADFVLNHMRENGEFVHTRGGALYYLRRDTGRPMYITAHGEWMAAYLYTTYGLNMADGATKFVINALTAYTKGIPQTGDMNTLSYYDNYTKRLLLHTGGRDVLHISADAIEVQSNGYGGTIFGWFSGVETITIEKPTLTDLPWHQFMFAEHLANLTNLEADEALAVLRAWMLFVLFRRLATTRPILCLTGAPGSGKTTIARKIYRLFYGEYKSVSGVTNVDDYDMVTATNPLVAYDNVDTWQPWLPDRLAASTADTQIEKRKLYTDTDMITMRRQALVLLTAHNPRFTREDVVDRMILLVFIRFDQFKDDAELMRKVSANRDRIWGSIVQDIQRILATPVPALDDCPQFRISDFSHLGVWFSRADGPSTEAAFRRAIAKISGNQRSFSLEQDQLLVNALLRMVERQPSLEYETSETIHSRLLLYAKDANAFQRSYRLPLHLSRKLLVMQNTLKDLFDINWKYADNGVGRLWRIAAKEKDVVPVNA